MRSIHLDFWFEYGKMNFFWLVESTFSLNQSMQLCKFELVTLVNIKITKLYLITLE